MGRHCQICSKQTGLCWRQYYQKNGQLYCRQSRQVEMLAIPQFNTRLCPLCQIHFSSLLVTVENVEEVKQIYLSLVKYKTEELLAGGSTNEAES